MTIASSWLAICEQIAKIKPYPRTTIQNQSSLDEIPIPPRIISTIAVSKRQAVDSIKQAYLAGALNFGESFVQEAISKIEQLKACNKIVWHFIGPIQSNKTQHIANHFDWVQSVSREKIAQRLNQHRPLEKLPLNILIQVNISEEVNKSGVSVNDISQLAQLIQSLPQLNLRGLMCIPEKTDDVKTQKKIFCAMYDLFDKTQKEFPQIDTLSMGMSSDFTSAIESGSNMVRIGTAIFGSRP